MLNTSQSKNNLVYSGVKSRSLSIFLALVIIASLAVIGCGNDAENKNQEAMPPADTSKGISVMAHDSTNKDVAYVCPCGGCPEVKESKPGKCPKCDLELVQVRQNVRTPSFSGEKK